MDFIQAYLPIFQFAALIFAAFIFFGYFREQNAAAQVLMICVAAYLAALILEKDPDQFINRFLQGIF